MSLGGGGGGGFGVFSSASEEHRKRTVPDRVLISRLFKYAEGLRRTLIIAVSSILVSSVTALCIPYLHEVAIDQVITPLNFSGFVWWIPIFVFVILVHYLVQYTQLYQMRILGETVVSNLRSDMMSKLEIVSLRYFSEGEIGRIMSRPINDAQAVRMFLRMGLTTIILDVSSLVGSLMIIFFLNAKLSILAVSILPVAFIVMWFFGRFSRRIYRRMYISMSGFVSRMQENLSGMRVIKAFVKEDEKAKETKKTIDDVRVAATKAVEIAAAYGPVVMTMRVIGTGLILYFGTTMVLAGEITVGMLVAFSEYQFSYFRPLMELVTAYDQYQNAMAALERMFDLVDTGVEVKDVSADRAVRIDTIDEVEFKNVSFGYDRNIPVIKGISFKIGKNQKLAIVGPTGAGKSTIINLLSRFYDPLDGEILVNGHNVKDIPIDSIRGHTSIVLQDSFLFPMTVKDNIRFGKPEATDEEVVRAAKAVGAHEFIMKLPNDYEYTIQEGSSNISIGQRQLISFARTLLMNPKLLILDEATSSIDPYTELVIQTALKNLLENRMAIIIAHRLSTIRLCDEILVIDHGQIEEKGTHSELMNRGGLYSSFYRMQFREEKGLEADVRDK